MRPHPQIPHNPVDDDQRPASEKFPDEKRYVWILISVLSLGAFVYLATGFDWTLFSVHHTGIGLVLLAICAAMAVSIAFTVNRLR